jgi:hypothetical protein
MMVAVIVFDEVVEENEDRTEGHRAYCRTRGESNSGGREEERIK